MDRLWAVNRSNSLFWAGARWKARRVWAVSEGSTVPPCWKERFRAVARSMWQPCRASAKKCLSSRNLCLHNCRRSHCAFWRECLCNMLFCSRFSPCFFPFYTTRRCRRQILPYSAMFETLRPAKQAIGCKTVTSCCKVIHSTRFWYRCFGGNEKTNFQPRRGR